MPNPVDVAKTRRAKIQREIQALQQEAARLDDFLQMYDALSRESVDEQPAPPPASEVLPALASQVSRRMEMIAKLGLGDPPPVTIKERVITTTKQLLAERGPLSTRDIYHALLERGVNPGGANEKAALSVILSKSEVFKYKPDSKAWIIRATQ